MGTFSVRFTVRHPVHGDRQLELEGLVDTGALFTQIPADVLTARTRSLPGCGYRPPFSSFDTEPEPVDRQKLFPEFPLPSV